MHAAYQEKSEETQEKSEDYGGATTEKQQDDELESAAKINSRRLFERLANFDARTNQMGGDWYLKFSDVRRGSFLPRLGVRKNATATDGEKGPRRRGRMTKNRISWQMMHPTSAIFLHWIGFDPQSALSPPNEETTQALGFLAYDFFGKIVEKVRVFIPALHLPLYHQAQNALFAGRVIAFGQG